MKFEIKSKPDFACLNVMLDNGEKLVTEPGAMMGMHPGLKMETNMQGGLFAAAKRALGGESLFQNTYTATGDQQQIQVAPAAPGDLQHIHLNEGLAVVVQRHGYVACTPGVTIDSKWQGAKGFFAGESMIMLRCHGNGELFVSSYGAIEEVDVKGTYIVDTSHIVAFEETLTYKVRSVGSVKSLLFSSEGMVCEFTGHGKLWFQTRSAPNLAAFLHPFRKIKPKKSN